MKALAESLTHTPIFLLIFFMFHMPYSWSAEIVKQNNWIIVTGEIENGDYDRFEKIIANSILADPENPAPLNGVALYSPGGAAIEAVRIGRAVRKLRLRTTGPTSQLGNKTKVYCPSGLGGSVEQVFYDMETGAGDERCSCNSACALIWGAGILRNGRAGFHRPHFTNVSIENYDSFEANGRTARQIVDQYLVDMDLPKAILIAVATTTQNELFFVDARSGFARTPTFDELASRECAHLGDITGIESEFQRLEDEETAVSQSVQESILARFAKFAACHVGLQVQLAERAFSRLGAIVKEIRRSNPNVSDETILREIRTYLGS